MFRFSTYSYCLTRRVKPTFECLRASQAAAKEHGATDSKATGSGNPSGEKVTQGFNGSKSGQFILWGGTVLGATFISSFVLLWQRRRHFHALNAALPPVEWQYFEENHLMKGEVAVIVYEPSYNTGGAFFRTSSRAKREKKLRQFFSSADLGGEKFAVTPDVRFTFDGSAAELNSFVKDALYSAGLKDDVVVEVNQFPSLREAVLIGFFGLVALVTSGLVKL